MGNPYPPIESHEPLPERMPDALLALAERLNRFKQSRSVAPISATRFANSTSPAMKLPETKTQSDYISTLIMEKDSSFSLEVVSKYAQYREPFKTLGEDSAAARRIALDERYLLAAYKLFKAAKQAEAEIGKGITFIKDTSITSPLAARSEYTTGGEFVYLKAWLMFEQKAIDYVPQFEPIKSGSLKSNVKEGGCRLQGTFTLTFVKPSAARETYRAKEILAAIKAAYGARDKP